MQQLLRLVAHPRSVLVMLPHQPVKQSNGRCPLCFTLREQGSAQPLKAAGEYALTVLGADLQHKEADSQKTEGHTVEDEAAMPLGPHPSS